MYTRVHTPTQHSVLGQRAVAHGVGSLVRGHVVHGDTRPLIHILIVEDVVTVTVEERQKKKKERKEKTTVLEKENMGPGVTKLDPVSRSYKKRFRC